jgi:DNA-binding SARP family transcriptional activator
MLRLWLCGRVAGECDGVPLGMPTSDRSLALIGWLALHPGLHPRAGVAARLWPDTADVSARANLRTAVWNVRQAWGPAADAVLDGSRNTIGFRGEQLWVDAVDALPLEDGELLPGIDDDWAHAARDEHRVRQLVALAAEADAAEQDGRHSDAVVFARRRCALAPLDETVHRDLLRQLEAAGDRAGAVVAARQFTEQLRRELGVRPSPATRAVQARLRTAALEPPRSIRRDRDCSVGRGRLRRSMTPGVPLLTAAASSLFSPERRGSARPRCSPNSRIGWQRAAGAARSVPEVTSRVRRPSPPGSSCRVPWQRRSQRCRHRPVGLPS